MGFGISNLFSSITRVFTGAPKISDYDAPAFYANTIGQSGYDREIDEGMSSGMRRYATLDVSQLSEAEVGSLIGGLERGARGFNLCKQIQVAGFNAGGKRYVAVSGESHLYFQGSAAKSFEKVALNAAAGLNVRSVGYVALPTTESDVYEPVNLGRYGTTGAPMVGVKAHGNAIALRAAGKIQ